MLCSAWGPDSHTACMLSLVISRRAKSLLKQVGPLLAMLLKMFDQATPYVLTFLAAATSLYQSLPTQVCPRHPPSVPLTSPPCTALPAGGYLSACAPMTTSLPYPRASTSEHICSPTLRQAITVLYGLALCFFGGHFAVSLAAMEAFRVSGG